MKTAQCYSNNVDVSLSFVRSLDFVEKIDSILQPGPEKLEKKDLHANLQTPFAHFGLKNVIA